jgi:formylglycine-generating enzyme required for sulfatase activity/DNA-directed RNA polymerase subunit RPC12/RpoP
VVKFSCKKCGQKLNVEDKHSGTRVKCPKCGDVCVVPDSSDKIKFHCENCGQSISVPQIHAGKKGKCPKCKNPIVVPSLKRESSDGAGTVSVVCPMCDEAIQVPETSRGQTIECPGCGSDVETSSGGVGDEPEATIPRGTDEALYQEETEQEEYEESEGVDRRIIVAISAVAAVVVVGLIILVAVLRSSGSRPAERPDDLRGQQQVAAADSRPQPVIPPPRPHVEPDRGPERPEAAAEEPIEAAPPPKPGDAVTNSIGMKLIYIPAGSFMMGSSGSATQLPIGSGPRKREYVKKVNWADEFPQHQVRISKGFWMARTEVTQGQYKSVMNAQPWSGRSYVQDSANNPAVYVTWDDAVTFCRELSQQEGKTYRLPTEAEWEYACRAGTTTRFSFGDSDSSLGDYAWFHNNVNNDVSQQYAQPVGQKKPNPWGLYDMHGNVWEWCSDFYDKDYYSSSPSVDPKGPTSGNSPKGPTSGNSREERVLLLFSVRGGSWGNPENTLGCSYRWYRTLVNREYTVGFRVVRSVAKEESQKEDAPPIESIAPEPPKEDALPTEPVSLEEKLYKIIIF